MRNLLIVLFSLILVAMLAITTFASFERNIVDAGRDLISDRWFQATLFDAYIGFVTFYVWVAYKERGLGGRVIWFVLIMLLGNIAISIYMLIQLAQLKPDEGWQELLMRHEPKMPPADSGD